MFHSGETPHTLRARRITDVARHVLPALMQGRGDPSWIPVLVAQAFDYGEAFVARAEKLAAKAEEEGRKEFASKVESIKKEITE